MLSTSCIYAIRAALYQAMHDSGNYIPIATIAKELDISFPFLAKVLQTLTQANLISSLRGPHGGVKLSRPADQITLLDIIKAIDGESLFNQCILKLPGCGERAPCPLHNEWKARREELRNMFSNTTLANLCHKIGREEEFRKRASDAGFISVSKNE